MTSDELVKKLENELENVTVQFIKYWIEHNLVHQKRYNTHRTSYGIKHIFSYDTGVYVTNDEFKRAMREMGYDAKDENALNHVYRVSESKSKAFNYPDGRKRYEV